MRHDFFSTDAQERRDYLLHPCDGEDGMKIRVDSNKIVKALKDLEGIEVVLESANDAKEAIDLIFRKTELSNSDEYKKLKDIAVTAVQEYETSAVDYNLVFVLEFVFENDVSVDTKVAFIKELQSFFGRF